MKLALGISRENGYGGEIAGISSFWRQTGFVLAESRKLLQVVLFVHVCRSKPKWLRQFSSRKIYPVAGDSTCSCCSACVGGWHASESALCDGGWRGAMSGVHDTLPPHLIASLCCCSSVHFGRLRAATIFCRRKNGNGKNTNWFSLSSRRQKLKRKWTHNTKIKKD